MRFIILFLWIVCCQIHGADDWGELRVRGKYDVLAKEAEKALDKAQKTKDLSLEVRACMELARIYTLDLTDFKKSEFYIDLARKRNDELAGRDFDRNIQLLEEYIVTLNRFKGAKISAKTRLFNSSEKVTQDAFLYTGKETMDRLHQIENSLLQLIEKSEYSTNARVMARIQAALVVVNRNRLNWAGGGYWMQELEKSFETLNRLQENISVADREALNKSRLRFAGSVASSLITSSIYTGLYIFTFGLADQKHEEFDTWVKRPIKSAVNSRQAMKTASLHASGSITARGYGLFLSPIEQISLKEAMAQILHHQQKQQEAIIQGERAVDLLEAVRKTLILESERIAFLKSRDRLYSFMVDSLMQLQRTTEALQYAERSRARAFVDLLAEKKIVFADKERQQFYEDVEDFHATMSSLLVQGELNQSQRGFIESKSRKLGVRAAQQQSMRDILIYSSIAMPQVNRVAESLPDDTRILCYFISEESVYGWLVEKKKITGCELPLSPTRLIELSMKIQQNNQKNPDLQVYEELGRLLLDPLLRSNSGKVLIIPHGVMHVLPFVAFNYKQQMLLHSHHVAYCPSLTTWLLLQEHKASDCRSLLAMGISQYPPPISPLPGVEKELIQISQFYPQKLVLLNDQASQAALFKSASQYSVIHLACHGVFEPDLPLESALLIPGSQGTRLTVSDIFSLKLNRPIIVLSACDTAKSRVTHGDEILGLVRSFFLAGGNRVVAGLWAVDDVSTKDLMVEFHRNLKSQGPSNALRMAQLKLASNESTRHPHFWAPFCVYGGF